MTFVPRSDGSMHGLQLCEPGGDLLLPHAGHDVRQVQQEGGDDDTGHVH